MWILFVTCMEYDHVGHQFMEGEITIQLTSCRPTAVLKVKGTFISWCNGRNMKPKQTWETFYLFICTWMEPRRKESRFLQTGSRISRQLKLRQAAGALARGKACWKQDMPDDYKKYANMTTTDILTSLCLFKAPIAKYGIKQEEFVFSAWKWDVLHLQYLLLRITSCLL